jgi:MazG family protein
MTPALQELLAIMARLRAPDGCPWDREQSSASLAPYTIEEAYEVVAAIESGDPAKLRDELGDLLLQVVFHAQIAHEAGQFDFDAVAAAIGAKLVRRHPHVFGDAAGDAAAAGATASELTSRAQLVLWEEIKARERALAAGGAGDGAPVSQLDDVPQALPALMRAHKLSKRAARVGFDFDRASEAADKVAEELAEVRAAAAEMPGGAAEPSAAIVEEVGDLLFAAANLARKLNVDAEAALRAANAKFERRFRGMERLAAARGDAFHTLDLAAQERLWQQMKREE